MMGLLCLSFLSSVAEAAGGLAECTNNLNICTTTLTDTQGFLATTQTNLAACQANLATCEANAQSSLSACQANLATCQAASGQTIPPPSWYQKLPCDSTSNCPRFEVLADWNNEAVLDKETGLVWEQSPSTATSTWKDALIYCNQLRTGGRMGWRLPTIQEVDSLVDTSVAPPGPTLPAGHPFSNVQSSYYWSATALASLTGEAWCVSFNYGVVTNAGGFSLYVWCVRGGQGVDPQ